MLEQLIEKTRDLYDGSAFLVGAFGEVPAKEQFAQRSLYEGFSFAQAKVKPVLDKSDFESRIAG